jgi:hypothetical protein
MQRLGGLVNMTARPGSRVQIVGDTNFAASRCSSGEASPRFKAQA